MGKIKKVAIIGLGLIGGSLGLAIKEKGLADEVVGIPRREVTIAEAVKAGAIDRGTLVLEEGVKNADLIFICTPIHLVIPKLREILPWLKPGAIVTDVASTKGEIVKTAEKIMPKGTHFIGGHPMAGKEKTGIAVAERDLFAGKTYILTPTAKTSKKAFSLLADFILALEVRKLEIDPKTHDFVVAGISHLPLAVAAALVETVASKKDAETELRQCAASGFRDTTRIASGDPVLGKDFFITNSKQVLKFLKNFKKTLKALEGLIRAGDEKSILDFLQKAKAYRDGIYG
ncbi:MAG: prephenate dehydrogenase/arogenate dehydrogenase family protein [Candidatus Saganbacteria bacterium]|nr:prephenate dehydrogenase/arogenate dehydrogenase family protein [Candidatus Saganbacteria bacterium]